MHEIHAFFSSGSAVHAVHPAHNAALVCLSVLLAVITATIGVQAASRARQAVHVGRWAKWMVLGSGVFAFGAGIWAMHFIGMLALQLDLPVNYRLDRTVLSMLPGLGAAGIALATAARGEVSNLRIVVAGTLVGGGIGLMHYSGMSAMQMPARLSYDPGWFSLSILAAAVIASLALWLRIRLDRTARLQRWRVDVASGVVLGLAVSAMHYLGMHAARFDAAGSPASGAGGVDERMLAASIAAVTCGLALFSAAANGLLHYSRLLHAKRKDAQRLRSIIETTVEGIVVLDARGTVTVFNDSAARMTGWDARAVIGRPAAGMLQAPSPELLRYLQESRPGDPGITCELAWRRGDGGTMAARLAIGRTDSDDAVIFVGFLSDIGEKQAIEAALREREEQYRTLVRNVPGVFFRCETAPPWRALFISDAIEPLVGWTAADFLAGRHALADSVHPDDAERFARSVREAVALGQRFQLECRIRHALNGTERWVAVRGEVVAQPATGRPWIDGILVDVTESRLRSAEYESKMRAIGLAMAVAEFDLRACLLVANDNFLRMMGYESDEVLGLTHAIFCTPEEAASPAYADFWAALHRGEFQSGQYRRLAKGGREVWVQATYNPILDADGRLSRILKLATDVTHLHDITVALREAKDRAEQAAAARTTFLANMSHEIRTPMNAVIGFTDLLLGTRLDGRQRSHLETVRTAARSLLRLLNDILDTAKLERGAMSLEESDFSLRQLVDQVVASLQVSAEGKGLSLTVDYPPSLGTYFRGDELRLQQVLLNLVGNAIKFTERGHVRVALAAEEGGMVRIAVHDTGIGIAPDRQSHIFDPFAQADVSMTRRFGGTGLGTTIARQLTELMGGRIGVDSTPGVGSVFHVRLPLPPGREPEDTGPSEAVAQLPPLRVLVVDDVPQNVELLEIALGAGGHRVASASDGEQAVRACTAEPARFDVVLMDVHMPGTDGLAATRRIRAHEQSAGWPRLPIVALTASVLDEDRRAARDAGMDGFASKPVDMDRLAVEIDRVLGGSPLAAALPSPGVPDGRAQASPVPDTAQAPVPSPDAADAIDWQRGVQLWGQRSTMARAIERFLGEHADVVDRLRALLARADTQAARALVHRMRGTSANLGLTAVHRCAGALEADLAGARADAQGAVARLGDLADAFDGVREALGAGETLAVAAASGGPDASSSPMLPAVLPAPAPRAADEGTAAQIAALAVAARDAILRGEIDEPALQRLAALLRGNGDALRAVAIERALQSFDFDRAGDLLQPLLGQAPADLPPTPGAPTVA